MHNRLPLLRQAIFLFINENGKGTIGSGISFELT